MLRAGARPWRRAAEAPIPIRLRTRVALLARTALLTATTSAARVGGVGRVGARGRALGERGTTHRRGEQDREGKRDDLLHGISPVILNLVPGRHLGARAPPRSGAWTPHEVDKIVTVAAVTHGVQRLWMTTAKDITSFASALEDTSFLNTSEPTFRWRDTTVCRYCVTSTTRRAVAAKFLLEGAAKQTWAAVRLYPLSFSPDVLLLVFLEFTTTPSTYLMAIKVESSGNCWFRISRLKLAF